MIITYKLYTDVKNDFRNQTGEGQLNCKFNTLYGLKPD